MAWRRHEDIEDVAAWRFFQWGVAVGALMLIAPVIACVIVYARGTFLTEPVDYLVVLLGVGGYFGCMRVAKAGELVAQRERAAGYTTSRIGYFDFDEVHWPTGVVLRDAGEPRLKLKTRRQRMARVQAYRDWASAEKGGNPDASK